MSRNKSPSFLAAQDLRIADAAKWRRSQCTTGIIECRNKWTLVSKCVLGCCIQILADLGARTCSELLAGILTDVGFGVRTYLEVLCINRNSYFALDIRPEVFFGSRCTVQVVLPTFLQKLVAATPRIVPNKTQSETQTKPHRYYVQVRGCCQLASHSHMCSCLVFSASFLPI